jgi:hypothetical protein
MRWTLYCASIPLLPTISRPVGLNRPATWHVEHESSTAVQRQCRQWHSKLAATVSAMVLPNGYRVLASGVPTTIIFPFVASRGTATHRRAASVHSVAERRVGDAG